MLTLGIGITQLDWLRWMNRRNGMLIDDLGAIASHKLDREAVEPSDPAQKLDPVHEKHRHINVAVAEMLQKGVLEG